MKRRWRCLDNHPFADRNHPAGNRNALPGMQSEILKAKELPGSAAQSGAHRLLQVGDQIGSVLEADVQADYAVVVGRAALSTR